MKQPNNNLLRKTNILGKLCPLIFLAFCMFLSCNSEKGENSKDEKLAKHSPFKDMYKKEIAEFTKVLEKNPRDYNSLKGRAKCLKDIGKYKQAIEDIDLAIEIDPSDSQAYRIRGEVLQGLRDYSASVAQLSEYISLNPDDPKGFFERAYSYERGRRIKNNADKSINDFKKAIELYSDESITLNPKDSIMRKTNIGSSYFGLGLACIQKKDYISALKAFENSDKFTPENKYTLKYIERMKRIVN